MLSTSLDHIVCGRRHVYAELVPPQVQFDTLFRRKKNRVIVHEEKERILQNIVDPEKITAFIEPPPKRLKKDLHQHGVVSFFPKKRLAEDLFIPNGVSAPPVHPYLAAWFEGIEGTVLRRYNTTCQIYLSIHSLLLLFEQILMFILTFLWRLAFKYFLWVLNLEALCVIASQVSFTKYLT